ncbi:MAG: HupE/UreJ family protein [Nitrospira sp.]|nr:MAG: HupE/UreJ family protein [Nitrospira sp.]
MRLILALAILLLLSAPAWAHKPSDSYLSFTVNDSQAEGRWDIALRDLDYAIGLDTDGDGAITWGEVRARHDAIASYAFSHLTVHTGKRPCSTAIADQLIDHHTDGTYAVLRFTTTCPAPIRDFSIDYRLLFELDAQHKGLLKLTGGNETLAAIFSQESPAQQFTIGTTSAWRQIRQYAQEGIWHIWLGYDHVLFLLALLLPSVLRRAGGRWESTPDFFSALGEVVAIVTAFTLAHSITLGLATLGLIALPSRLVESAIAASVIYAACANLYPALSQRRWLVAFLFGLIHGFGFATVLSDLGLPKESLALSLVSFNLGVEVGQLAIVAMFLPMAYGLRRSWSYQRLVLVSGSLAIAGLACAWLIERTFDLKLIPL